jgi:hypothetical protein
MAKNDKNQPQPGTVKVSDLTPYAPIADKVAAAVKARTDRNPKD